MGYVKHSKINIWIIIFALPIYLQIHIQNSIDRPRAVIELSEEEKLALESLPLEEGLSDSASTQSLTLQTVLCL